MAVLTLDALTAQANSGETDTVLVCAVDMQGRLMGKRYHVAHFLEHAQDEAHCCNYLLATDLEMGTPEGYATTSWQLGYGDYLMKPDLGTLRPVPWLDGTVLVLCDLLDPKTHAPVPQSPRQILKTQIERAGALGFTPMMATELEFFLFARDYNSIRASGFRDLETLIKVNQDYSIQMTGREEYIMRPVRNTLYAMGIPVENTKGEAETGQEELNIRYAGALGAADHHTLAKQAVKEIAEQKGHAATFMAKWRADRLGSAAHLHQSLFADGENAFHDPEGAHGMSKTMGHYVAGLLKYAPETMLLLAPYINSYKRFIPGTFAPTKIAWSVDNRTAGFRLVGEGGKGVRIECRIPGADMNPYLACAAQLAAGLAGIEEELPLPAPARGDLYAMEEIPEVPATLRAATETFRASKMLRKTLGDAVVDHYTRAAEVEQEDFDRAVTDYELRRGFERV
ncbi:glutamine synthetase family protein [Salipiger sp. P9]|uniref:glutamine synthetase family protein n=1 Tax=Salipiger pentaromativorans TaxID=2943193 RepID=UPI0021578E36|nr:glutamine synthetase family protein [Salipiger pentaromativorans]MCR8546722.1 glutamine synthetase family protein [Salipiger pentaromativorans]